MLRSRFRTALIAIGLAVATLLAAVPSDTLSDYLQRGSGWLRDLAAPRRLSLQSCIRAASLSANRPPGSALHVVLTRLADDPDDPGSLQLQQAVLSLIGQSSGAMTLGLLPCHLPDDAGPPAAPARVAETAAAQIAGLTGADLVVWGDTLPALPSGGVFLTGLPDVTAVPGPPAGLMLDLAAPETAAGVLVLLTLDQSNLPVSRRPALLPTIRASEAILAPTIAAPPARLTDRQLGALYHAFAHANQSLAAEPGQATRLDLAAAAFERAADQFAAADDRWRYAAAQTALADTLAILGSRDTGTDRLEQSAAAFRAALFQGAAPATSLQGAAVQTRLAAVLRRLGERTGSAEWLEQAIAAYRAALVAYQPDLVPPDWAAVQSALGETLAELGTLQGAPIRQEQSVAAFRLALLVTAPDREPQLWARTQVSLGDTLRLLAVNDARTWRLEQAATAYRAALQVFTPEAAPEDHVGVQIELGGTLQQIGERTATTGPLEEAAAAYRLALTPRSRSQTPMVWAATQVRLGGVLQALGAAHSSPGWLEQALLAHDAALLEYRLDRLPQNWVATKAHVGDTLVSLGLLMGSRDRLEQAVTTYNEALQADTGTLAPLERAALLERLGHAELLLFTWSADAARLDQAMAHATAARDLFLAHQAADRAAASSDLLARIKDRRSN